MKKIFIIIGREFLSRVKKKSFIITTLLVPLFMAALMVIPFYIQGIEDTEQKIIMVIDNSGLAEQALESAGDLTFIFTPTASIDSLRQNFKKEGLYAVLVIGETANNAPVSLTMYSFTQPGLSVQTSIERSLKRVIETEKLKAYDIEGLDAIMADIKTDLSMKTFIWDESGKEKASSSILLMGISYILTFIIYFFIFMFGMLVMRGVIEEKANRIVEVIISSVKPFQLMLGKIIGVASVGLLQFVIWIVLTIGMVIAVQNFIGGDDAANVMVQNAATPEAMQGFAKATAASDIFSLIGNINFLPIIISFLFFFLFGYLLYASLFAAIGSAVENEADTQQLTLPVTIPLIIGLFIMMHTFQYPNSSLSFWASIIPFTSPMVMMARIPFGVPLWEILLSLSLLFITFLAIVWFAGKIYRVGILMYGKKPGLKEMWKWLRYKN
ncbi:MAG: ABC transporter permease [Prevotellaceae bacterium]|jgi:ABC-2 type transport system permease protein|nr:ABC transporter permease [Prevotellaceae bacterium]